MRRRRSSALIVCIILHPVIEFLVELFMEWASFSAVIAGIQKHSIIKNLFVLSRALRGWSSVHAVLMLYTGALRSEFNLNVVEKSLLSYWKIHWHLCIIEHNAR